MKPLSEDQRLFQPSPLRLTVDRGQNYDWNEVTTINPGEKRVISISVGVGKGGQGQMLRVFFVPDGAKLTVLQKVKVEDEGSWQSFIAVRGGGEVNIHRDVELEGISSRAELTCVGVLDNRGSMALADEIFSESENSQSQILTKLVLNDTSQSEARARIVVSDQSVGSQAFERLDHLLVGDKAKAAAIPELEVKTDKVKCGHAATTSRPDERQKWYLESRGLDSAEVDRMLIQAFMAPGFVDLPEDYQIKAKQVLFA